MNAYQLFKQPSEQALDTAANVLSGATLTFSLSTTDTPTDAFSDSTLATPLANPYAADSAGVWAPIFLDPAITYRIVLKSAAGAVLKTWDPANENVFSAELIGLALYPQTADELLSSVTVVNYAYEPLIVDRYGTNTTPGTTGMAAAFNAAVKVAKVSGGVVRYGKTAPYRLEAAINCTDSTTDNQPGYTIRGDAPFSLDAPRGLVADHTGHVFDCTGAAGIHFDNVTVGTGTSSPDVCWLLARNSHNLSQSHRFTNCRAIGEFSKTILYNYASESGVYHGLYLWNTATNAGTSVVDISANNIRSLSSSFVTIATGAQSCIDHQFFGGQFVNTSGDAASDVFRLDQASSLKFFGAWGACFGVASNGRALIYVDLANGASSLITVHGFTGEQSSGFIQTYGILFSNTLSTPTKWDISACVLPCATAALSAGANVTLDSMTWRNVYEPNNRGIAAPGTIQNSILDTDSLTVVIGTSTKNKLCGQSNQWTITTRSNDIWEDMGSTNKTWTPNTSALTVTGALTISHKRCLFYGNMVTVSMQMAAATSIVCAAGIHITGLPTTVIEVSGNVTVHNVTTNVRIAGGYVDGTGINLPAINVTTDSILITATYWAA